MSAPAKPSHELVTSRRQLIEHLESGCKPADQWRMGTEHEKFAYTVADGRPLTYEGPSGVRAVLDGLTRFGWKPVMEGDNVIALLDDTGASVSLEPGGQVELSGAPVETVHQTCREVNTHLWQVKQVASELGVGFLGLGFNPKWQREDIPWMPKGRYKIMRDYMPKVGSLGLDMMLRTCTVQVNLDFGSEADMVKKMRVSLALQPVATALWANSPFRDGKPTDYLSLRSQVWSDTDGNRTGMLPFAFEDGFGFEHYVDWVLDVPMYFVYRDGRYVDASGQSFRDFLQGRLPALPGEVPTIGDWNDHLTTVFPEVRLKKYIEMRGADGGPWRRLCALPAFWAGLLYDQQALDAAWELVKGWTAEQRQTLRDAVPRTALKTPVDGRTVRELALDLLDIAHGGLKRRAMLDEHGRDETVFLQPLRATAEAGITPAEEMLEAFQTRWQGRVDPAFRELAY